MYVEWEGSMRAGLRYAGVKRGQSGEDILAYIAKLDPMKKISRHSLFVCAQMSSFLK